jgi:light-regulated signal transduction histidine kinase (bacteriophytochrome)
MSAHHSPAPEARLQAAEQELSEFTYIVSHDLAATFRHVRAFSDLLRQEGGFTPQQDNYCRQVQTAADKCAAMLEQLLTYSRVMRQPLKLEDCALDGLLDTVRLRLGEEIRRSGAVITAGPLGRARVDRDLFVQALHQLAHNAIKFRREGVAPRLELAAATDGTRLRLTLCDNGIGLGDLDPERLFGMFTRGHAEGAYAGCGAGLTIARRILRRHGGEVRFVPRPDGACVEIELPRDEEPSP